MDLKKQQPLSLKEKSLKFLSEIEIEILQLTKKGFTSVEIAKIRKCSKRTIEKHRSTIIKKLELPTAQNALLLYHLKNRDTDV
jgi:DNA-binding NarL/FixJ family response regulator